MAVDSYALTATGPGIGYVSLIAGNGRAFTPEGDPVSVEIIKVVDTLGCAYVQVDHRYFNENTGAPETDYTSINLQPGYQKLCYENALDYVRYRHTDSDFVRVARQQDFLRDLRQQINPANELGQIENVAKAVGHAIRSNFPASASELIQLAKLVAFSQSKPLRQNQHLGGKADAALAEEA